MPILNTLFPARFLRLKGIQMSPAYSFDFLPSNTASGPILVGQARLRVHYFFDRRHVLRGRG